MINRIVISAGAVCLISMAVIACETFLPDAPNSADVLNEPIAELTSEQLLTHLQGDVEFGRVFGQADGLGPTFVSNSCESCHIADGKGHPLTTLTRFGRYIGSDWDPMIEFGGPQLQHRAVAGYSAEFIPAEATSHVTQLMPPAVTGLGYLQAVDDSTLLALADPTDANADGITGEVNWITPQPFFTPRPGQITNAGKYIGRFGRKAGAIDLLQQVVGAYIQDIGITSDFHMEELYNFQIGHESGDAVADPEVPASTVNNVVFYMRSLKIPPRRNENDAEVLAGETLFDQAGCASCHLPTLTTGKSDIEALSEKTIHPYTDLLLHDMGPGLDDGYTEGTAQTWEWRTTPLWGLGLSKNSQGGSALFLHDGRAKTIEEAISLHGGEAAASAGAFNALTAEQKKQIIKFLNSL